MAAGVVVSREHRPRQERPQASGHVDVPSPWEWLGQEFGSHRESFNPSGEAPAPPPEGTDFSDDPPGT